MSKAARGTLTAWLWRDGQARLTDARDDIGRCSDRDLEALAAGYGWLYQRGGQHDLAHPAEDDDAA